jgi:desulfoferrodoxin-like iron-binding protein
MDKGNGFLTRRDFLHTAAMGAAVLASGPVFTVGAKDEKSVPAKQEIFVCGVCGHVEFGAAPEKCPVCHASKDNFTLSNTIFTDAMTKFKDKETSHTPVISIKKEPVMITDVPCLDLGVRVGKTMHPMEEAHHIKFIDWYLNDKFVDRFFTPLQLFPAVNIYLKPASGLKVRTVSLCNLHGYWQAETPA